MLKNLQRKGEGEKAAVWCAGWIGRQATSEVKNLVCQISLGYTPNQYSI